MSRVLGNAPDVTSGGNRFTPTVGDKRKYETTRVAKPKPPARAPKVTSMESILDGSCFPSRKRAAPDDQPTCCSRGCNLFFAQHGDSIARIRARVPPTGTGQQRARKIFVRSCIQDDKTLSLRDDAGVSAVVCHLFFVAVTGCSKTLIASAMDIGDVGMKPRHVVNSASQVVMAFIMELARRCGFRPNSQNIQNIHMAFPSKYVYELFRASPACHTLDAACSYPYFVMTWNKHCPQVHLKKAERFTKCDMCSLATEALDRQHQHQEGGDGWESEAMSVIRRTLEDHTKDVTRCRGVYMAAKLLSLQRPNELLCIAIDESDPSSYAFPSFKQETKHPCKGWKMHLKLIGALVTGRLCHFFTIGTNWESGSNLIIQVLHSTLVELLKTSEASGTPLPRKLHLQLDNCRRGNSIRFFLGYLHLLVSLGIFDVIEMHFGLKGHTHDEIDQVLRKVGVALRQTDCATRSILGKHIVGSYKKNASSLPVRMTHLYNCGNIRELLDGSMFVIPSVTMPQAFRVSRDPSDNNVKVQMQSRGYEDKWGAIDRKGEYKEGFLEVMRPGPLPDLKSTPDCPRKAVDAETVKQHRHYFTAAEDRIRISLLHDNEEINLDQAMLELEASAVDLEDSTPVPFDWDLSLYGLDPLEGEQPPSYKGSEQLGGGGGGEPPGLGEGGGTPESGLKWEVGWFVAYPLAANNPCSVVVGKIVEVLRDKEGDEVKVHWYRPKKRAMPRRRSMYGKGGWSQEFRVKEGSRKRVPDKGRESVLAACATFPDLLSGSRRLPNFVWKAVAEIVPPPEEEGEEEEWDEREAFPDSEEDKGECEEDTDRQTMESGWRQPVVPRRSLTLPALVRTPIRLTPEAFRLHRGVTRGGNSAKGTSL